MDANSSRTNNNIEDWHNKLKRVARKAYEPIKIFKQEQPHTEVSTAQLVTGSQPPKMAKKFISKDNKIEEQRKGKV